MVEGGWQRQTEKDLKGKRDLNCLVIIIGKRGEWTIRAILFDTETSGLIQNELMPVKDQPHIIELYACIVDDEVGPEPLEELEFLCKPPVKLEPIITNITGLTDAILRDKPAFQHYAPEVQKFWKRANAVVAHNLAFDHAMLRHEFARIGQELEWPKILCCTVASTEHLQGFRLTLQKLHEHLFGQGFEGGHRARIDVLAMARCWVELRKRGEL